MLFISCLWAASVYSQSNDNTLSGTYRYEYPDNTPTLNENHYIVLEQSRQGGLTGMYYGTTDEFDEAREGYYPGFFVARMDSLRIDKDTITFVIKVSSSDFFKRPVSLQIKTPMEAHKKKLQVWDERKLTATSKRYKGLISKKELFFKGESSHLDKKFIQEAPGKR